MLSNENPSTKPLQLEVLEQIALAQEVIDGAQTALERESDDASALRWRAMLDDAEESLYNLLSLLEYLVRRN